MKTERIDARTDPKWFEKAKEEMINLRSLRLTGEAEQIKEFLESPEYQQYKKAMNAKVGKWKTEGMLTIDPSIEF